MGPDSAAVLFRRRVITGLAVVSFAALVAAMPLLHSDSPSTPAPQRRTPPAATPAATPQLRETPSPPPPVVEEVRPLRRLRLAPELGGALVGVTDDVLVVGDTPPRPYDAELVLAGGIIRHPSSGMAVGLGKPIGVGDPPELVLHQDRERYVRLELAADGSLRETGGRRTVHTWHGAYGVTDGPPALGSSLVLSLDSPRRLRFETVTVAPAAQQVAKASTPRKKIVIGTFVHVKTRDRSVDEMLDAAAVMMHRVWQMQSDPNRKYDYSLLCIITNTSEVLRGPLERLGWRVVQRELSVEPFHVRNPRIAKELLTDGALGIWEIVKLEAWLPSVTGEDTHAALICDLDVHFRSNIEELFSPPWFPEHASLAFTQGAWPIERLNGGFLIIRPDSRTEEDHRRILDVLRQGDFRVSTGWKGTGYGWTYGGRTMQGLLPYYYVVGPGKGRAVRLPRCLFNNMVNSAECMRVKADDVVSNHFTGGCQKPWGCSHRPHQLCRDFVKAWWRDAGLAAAALGTSAPSCRLGYSSMKLTNFKSWQPFWQR